MDDRSEFRSDIPSPPEVELFVDLRPYAGASGSVGDALYMIS